MYLIMCDGFDELEEFRAQLENFLTGVVVITICMKMHIISS